MPQLEVARYVTQDELRNWRRRLPRGHRRGVAQGARVLPRALPSGSPDSAVMEVESLRPATPRQAFQATLDQILRWGQASKDEYLQLVKAMRVTNPWQIAHLTDEQAADMLEDGARRKAEESVRRVYHRLGRSRELQVKIGGF